MISGIGKYFASIFTTGEINIYAIEKIFSAREFSEENLSRIKLPKTESNATSRNLSNRSKTQKSIQSLSSIKQEVRDFFYEK